jgi:hypothetical protein
MEHGYKFKVLKAFEYSQSYLFNEYVDHFYNTKKNSIGPQRFIAKMHLNQLYGYFGRKLDLIETVNINANELFDYVKTRVIKSMIQIDENTITLLLYSNLNREVIASLNKSVNVNIKNDFAFVKSNVGIASAVTSYAPIRDRIHMIPFKLKYDILYSDTDSIFSSEPLPMELIGKELGLMKDELNGSVIEEACFIGIKQYGYWYLDRDGNKVESSVFSGVTRNTISFNEMMTL